MRLKFENPPISNKLTRFVIRLLMPGRNTAPPTAIGTIAARTRSGPASRHRCHPAKSKRVTFGRNTSTDGSSVVPDNSVSICLENTTAPFYESSPTAIRPIESSTNAVSNELVAKLTVHRPIATLHHNQNQTDKHEKTRVLLLRHSIARGSIKQGCNLLKSTKSNFIAETSEPARTNCWI